MKIKFEIRDNRSKTPCPYGFTNGYEGTVKMVGSYACAECRHFINITIGPNNKDNIIECNMENK